MIYYLILVLSLSAALLESFSYSGFVANHIYVPSTFFYIISFLTSLFVKPRYSPPKKIIYATVFSAALIYALSIAAETYFYPNYLFSHFHLNPLMAQIALALLIYHSLILLKIPWFRAFVMGAICYVAVDGAGRTLGFAARGLAKVVTDPLATYDQKLSRVYPGFYPTMMEIVRLTKDDSTIFIPPQSNPWELEGNAAMVRYFVYPRKVVNLGDTLFVPKVDGSAYVLVSKGSAKARTTTHDYGWPKSTWTGKNAWKLNSNQVLVEQPDNTYIYDPDNLWEWGLIEVDYAE